MDNAQVTEADRKAAADLINTFPLSLGWADRDDLPTQLVEAFARHRLERSVGWMGIESAPKDGRWFLAYWPVQTFEDRVQTSRWLHDDYRFVDASDFMDDRQPTHWQPLPSAPGTTPPEPVAEIERLRDKFASILEVELSESYDCTRVWSAWGYGTMGEDDFAPVINRIDEIANELARAALGDAS